MVNIKKINLNERQLEASNCLDGPLLILAGAGAGKTKTIIERIINLIKSGIEPEKIIAITFTNKAAREMSDRIEHHLKNDKCLNQSQIEKPFIGTFHSLGVKIIRSHAKKIGFSKYFAIYDRTDSKKIIKESIIDCNLDIKKFDAGKVLSIISKAKGDMIYAEDYSLKQNDYFKISVAKIWNQYEKKLKENNALDFDDLLLKSVTILREPEILHQYQEMWTHIHIDEYQDTNVIQYEMSRLLSGKERNVCVVGDIDQNIYSWRGARLQNIFNFENDYPEAKIILLEENYRSTKTILEAANVIIEKNIHRKPKKLFTKNQKGELITLHTPLDEVSESNFISKKALSLIKGGVDSNQIAVLYRANFQSRILEEAFLSEDIPYQVVGIRFFERKEIKDVLSYIGSALDEKNIHFIKRAINNPPRGIGKVSLLKIIEGKKEKLPLKIRKSYENFLSILEQIRQKMDSSTPSEVVKFVIQKSSLEKTCLKNKDEECVENIRELVTLAKRYDNLPTIEAMERFLTDTSLGNDQDELDNKKTKNGVKLMTVHSAKGLEFDYVFISGLEDGLFPHRKLNDGLLSPEEQEEERRLFYVALTRARKKLFLTYSQSRMIFGTRVINLPSEFILDLPDELIEIEEGEYESQKKSLLSIDF